MQKNNKYLEKYDIATREKMVNLIINKEMSYREIEKKYNVPRNTVFRWVQNYKKTGSVETQKITRKNKEINYKEQYEILKKYQAFLKEQQEKN